MTPDCLTQSAKRKKDFQRVTTVFAIIVLAIWLILAVAPGRFWQIERDTPPPQLSTWPAVVAIIPARNEETLIGVTLKSLWRQDYPGELRIVVADDRSDDGTADVARNAAREM